VSSIPLPPGLLDQLAEPLLVFDASLRLQFANRAALRGLPVEHGMGLADLEQVLTPLQRDRLRAALASPPTVDLPSGLSLGGSSAGWPGTSAAGSLAPAQLWRIDAQHHAILLPLDDSVRRTGAASAGLAPHHAVADNALRQVHALLWASAFPATLQDEAFRLLDVNPAFEALCGRARTSLIGRDPLELLDATSQLAALTERAQFERQGGEAAQLPAQAELRFVDPAGQVRHARAVRQFTHTDDGRRLLLTLLQETTAEHVAREQAERSSRELDQWFDLSPLGLALFDASGLVLRSNQAFADLVGAPLVELRAARPAVRDLLRLDDGGGPPLPSNSWHTRHGELPGPDGVDRWVRAMLRRYEGRTGQRRTLCVLEDRSTEQQLDLAQHQLGALVGSAGVGIVTFAAAADGVGPVALSTSAPVSALTPGHGTFSAAATPGAALVAPAGLAADARPAVASAALPGDTGAGPADRGWPGAASMGEADSPVSRASGGPGAGAASAGGPVLAGAGASVVGSEVARGAALQAIRRELVAPGSLPEFERLQRALRQGEACEVRYAIQHPELGERWLLTRVEPGRLGSGQASTSVVTLDITEQQQAHQRAEQLLGELTTILDNSPAGIASLRGDVLVHCNQRFERMLGLLPGSGPGASLSELMARHGSTDLDAALQAALADDRSFECELCVGEPEPRRPAADAFATATHTGRVIVTSVEGARGDAHWYSLTVRRTGPADQAPQAIAVLSEITRLKAQQAELEGLASERSHMALALGQQADRTRAVLDSVLVGIVTVGGKGEISWLNRSARRMFGGDLGDFLGQPVASAATDEPDHPLRAAHRKLAELADGEAQQFECRLRGRDGRVFWVVGNVVATITRHGARELTYALLDIDQRRQAETRIAAARESLQRIIEAAPMAITLCDASSLAVLQINHVAAQLCGLTPAQALGCAPEQLWPPLLAAQVRADLQSARLCAPEAPLQREYRLRRGGVAAGDNIEAGDAASEDWDARFLPLARSGAPAEQILMVASDVTDQRAAQRAELEAAIAQREMLVQEVHHRIKNNLQGVAGLLQQIGQRRPEVRPVIAEVVGQVQAIAQVYGLQVGGVGPLRVAGLVEAIGGSLQRTFGRRIVLSLPPEAAPGVLPAGVSVNGEPAGGWSLPESEAIPIALTLNELLTNAIKHSPAGSEVECRVESSATGVSLSIVNQGQLPEGFRIDHRPSAVSGLGLVRSLLPRRNASLHFMQSGELVIATVMLAPPVVRPANGASPRAVAAGAPKA
jgi:PAS domain S-box-containing protein